MPASAIRPLIATAAATIALASLGTAGAASAVTATAPTAYVVVPHGLVPINVATGTTGTTIPYQGDTVRQLLATPDQTKLYGEDGFGVIPFSLPTQTAQRRLGFHRVQGIAITPNGKTMFVAAGALRVYPVPTATDKPGKPIKLANNAFAIAITPNGKTLYTAGNYTGSKVTPVNVATGRAERFIRVGDFPDAIAVTPNGKTAYVASLVAGTITPISTRNNRPGKPIKIPHGGPLQIVVTPNSKTAYVLSEPETGDNGYVTPINVATGRVGKQINVGQSPGIIAIAPNGRTAYVSYDISQKFGVIPISTATSRAGKAIPLAGLPTFIAFTPDGKLAYVTDDGAGEVTPIRVATNTPEPPIKVGPSNGIVASILFIR